jgi:hypothetical protein
MPRFSLIYIGYGLINKNLNNGRNKKGPVFACRPWSGLIEKQANQLSRMIINPDVSKADMLVRNHLTALNALLPSLSTHLNSIINLSFS